MEKLAGSGARSWALPRSKTWTQENQLGDYDNTLCGMMWLEDPTIGWLIVCPALNPTTAHILFYYILFVWLTGSSPSLYTNPGRYLYLHFGGYSLSENHFSGATASVADIH